MTSVVRLWPLGVISCTGLALAVAIGCGESSEGDGGQGDDDSGGMAGSAPRGGDGNTTGGTSAGEGGAGDSGSATGGASGSATGGAGEGGLESGGTSSGGTSTGGTGTGGTAGEGGGSGSGQQPECRNSDDCRMVSDCCGCRSEPLANPTACALTCVRDACAEIMVSVDEVDCVQGRCVIARRCDGQVDCPAQPPNCEDGTVPSVVGDCWGPCLPATDCQSVSSCADCGDDFCVEFQAFQSIFSCVTRVDQCDVENYCQCLGVCGECSETDDEVQCPCISC